VIPKIYLFRQNLFPDKILKESSMKNKQDSFLKNREVRFWKTEKIRKIGNQRLLKA